MSVFFLLFIHLVVQVKSLYLVEHINRVNERPIIGILAQEMEPMLDPENHYKSYIVASYVKFIESAGARAVPIWIGQPESYYKEILSKLNGVLFPGGSSDFNNTHGYANAGRVIYRIAKTMNENGEYFPIWGTCLGFELLTYVAAGGVEHRVQCSSDNQVLPLKFQRGYENSRMFRDAPQNLLNILKNENVTANFHNFCVTKSGLEKVNLTGKMQVISMNQDVNGLTFISSLEHLELPFYAVQFHPEKNNYEWPVELMISHSKNAVQISQYFANFFVNEARKNSHSFPTREEEIRNLIYNYPVTYTYKNVQIFEQSYFFEQ